MKLHQLSLKQSLLVSSLCVAALYSASPAHAMSCDEWKQRLGAYAQYVDCSKGQFSSNSSSGMNGSSQSSSSSRSTDSSDSTQNHRSTTQNNTSSTGSTTNMSNVNRSTSSSRSTDSSGNTADAEQMLEEIQMNYATSTSGTGARNVLDNRESTMWKARGFPQTLMLKSENQGMNEFSELEIKMPSDRAYQFKVLTGNGRMLADYTNNTQRAETMRVKLDEAQKAKNMKIVFTGCQGLSCGNREIEVVDVSVKGSAPAQQSRSSSRDSSSSSPQQQSRQQAPQNVQTPVATSRSTAPTNASGGQAAALDQVNAFRTANGMRPLSIDAKLTNAAQKHSTMMANARVLSHSIGGSLGQRVSNVGYNYRAIAENIAVGQRNYEEAVNAWINSPPHRANLLDGNVTELGFGKADGGGRTYWTVILGDE